MISTRLQQIKLIAITIALSLPLTSQAQYATSSHNGGYGVFSTQSARVALRGQVNLKLNSSYHTSNLDSKFSSSDAAAAMSFGLSNRIELSGQVTGFRSWANPAAVQMGLGLAGLGIKYNLYSNRMSGMAHGVKLNVVNPAKSFSSHYTAESGKMNDSYSVEAIYLASIPLSYHLKSTINVGYAHRDLRSNRKLEDQLITSIALQWKHSKRLSLLAGFHANTTLDSKSEYLNDNIRLAAGVHYSLSSGIGLEVAVNRNLDGLRRSMSTRESWGVQLGLSLSLETRMPDGDGDGIDDRRDLAPNTPRGWKVDKFGVPMDTDKDGVADTVDLEARSPFGAKVDAYGVSQGSDEDKNQTTTSSDDNTDDGQASSRSVRKRLLRNYKITVDRLPTTGFGQLT